MPGCEADCKGATSARIRSPEVPLSANRKAIGSGSIRSENVMPHLVLVVGANPEVLIGLNVDSAPRRSNQKRIVTIVGQSRKRRKIHAADAGQKLAVRVHLGEMAVAVNCANLPDTTLSQGQKGLSRKTSRKLMRGRVANQG